MEQTGEPLETAGGEPTLQRTISLWQMTLYGAGGMLGAGIYGLIGQVAAEMGSAIWLAFALVAGRGGTDGIVLCLAWLPLSPCGAAPPISRSALIAAVCSPIWSA